MKESDPKDIGIRKGTLTQPIIIDYVDVSKLYLLLVE